MTDTQWELSRRWMAGSTCPLAANLEDKAPSEGRPVK
ncbi:unnamed protein product [Tetraodon nigroviridis]|uniref:Chromosome undetermined SCAF14651, whole genome shotgun sequence n=1 Tax=Tetraodon nigroviridis TaxID=99883 RepID=Q4SCN9_TETNG|nr:unnamed protein product [Tetraodon nigroviridis]